MAQDLVGEDETVECPECGKECEGRESIKSHYSMKHKAQDESSRAFFTSQKQIHEHWRASKDHPRRDDSSKREFYTSQKQIHEQIAEDSSFDYKTVKRLVNVASIPFTKILGQIWFRDLCV